MRFDLKRVNVISAICLFALVGLVGCESTPRKASDEEIIKSTISKMTLEQKVQVLIGTGMNVDLPDSIKEKFGAGDPAELGPDYETMVNHIRGYLPGAAGFSSEFEGVGVTSQVLSDGPAGLRIEPEREGDEKTYYCTAFPIATVLASSWDTDLVYKVGKAMGNEVLEYGSDVLLAPGMNIQRDPLCGRNFEYYSEDPLVTGKMAAAMVEGIQSNGVGTSIKHFAANNQETNRMSVNTIASQRALREIYLKGFEIAVKEAKPWTVMSSYNKLNGVYTSESHGLLTDVLRKDWGFDGYVMTDWGGGSDVVAQMKAGNDMIQPGSPKQVQELISAVNEGAIDEEVLDKNLSRIFKIMLKTPRYQGYKPSLNPDLKAHGEVTRQAATDGMVLLENRDQALPIAASVKKVAAFGNTSYDFVAGGTGSGDVNEAYTVSLLEGLENGGYEADDALTEIYQKYIAEEREKGVDTDNWLATLMKGKIPVTEMTLPKGLARKMAETNDLALITIGRNSGEGGDRKAEAGDFYLTKTEQALIREVTDAFHAKGKKAIVVLNIGGAIETASWTKIPDAVLLAWQPGQEAGNSVVDVLSGKVNPSGKLAVTFPVSYDDAPSSQTFPGHKVESEVVDDAADLSGFSFMERVPWEVVYDEDIYVGYRYYNTFDVPVAYEFGYGLSYTNFEYSNLKLSSDEFTGELSVTVDVKNTGSVAGREVVQVYASAPEVKLEKPAEELVAFGKTKLLAPGEKESLSFAIQSTDLASFDEAMSAWIVEPGTYQLKVAASAIQIKGQAEFTVADEIQAGTVSNVLAPEVEFKKLGKK